MRGVVGLELEILRAKARGERYPCEIGTAAYDTYLMLIARGLLAEVGLIKNVFGFPGETVLLTEITQTGRVVLAASMDT